MGRRLIPGSDQLRTVDLGTAAAIAFYDEPVTEGPPPAISPRFALATSIAAGYSVHLVDWCTCDDQMWRSRRLALFPDEPWWPVP
jgi:hypothetical protein